MIKIIFKLVGVVLLFVVFGVFAIPVLAILVVLGAATRGVKRLTVGVERAIPYTQRLEARLEDWTKRLNARVEQDRERNRARRTPNK